ncbi:MAG: hypothetical protein AAGA99_06990 [Actinomycetota bacterium]
MPNRITEFNTDTIDSQEQIQWRAGHAKERLAVTAKSQKIHDRRYRKQIKSAQRKQAEAERLARRAEEYRAAGRPKRAKRIERRAQKAQESADRIRAKAEQRWREDSTRTGRKRTALKWALGGTLAATTAVAAGMTVVAPSVYGNDLVRPNGNEIEVGLPPEVEGDPPRPPAPVDAANDADDDSEDQADGGADERQPAAEAPAEVPVGVIVHGTYVGSRAAVTPGVQVGLAFTITSVETGTTIHGETIDAEHGALAALTPTAPGKYVVTIDGSKFEDPDCVGQYTAEVTVPENGQAVVTAHFKDQVGAGDLSYGKSCVGVEYRTAR